MANKQKLPRFEDQGSSWEDSGLFAANDWRYEALVDYLKLSPSYKLVCEWARNGSKTVPSNAPKDWDQLVKTYKDFGDVWRIQERLWWRSRGTYLFGIKAAQSKTFAIGLTDSSTLINNKTLINAQLIWEDMAKPECLVIAIPTDQTKQMALKQINAIVKNNSFAASKAKLVQPRYELIRSKLREPTIKLGIFALQMYQRGIPLWMIGNKLKLSAAHTMTLDSGGNPRSTELNTAEKKIRLQVLASKLITKAELIAENAARGLYPTDAPCKFALKHRLSTRKAGRPIKSK